MPDQVFDDPVESGEEQNKDSDDPSEQLIELIKLQARKDDPFPEKLHSVNWEDMEPKDDKTGNDLIACDNQYVYIWDI